MAFANPINNVRELPLSPGMSVADFGAGAGHYAVAAADAVGETGEVFLIDIQESLLTKARSLDGRRRAHLRFIKGDLNEPGGSHLADGSVDAVIISNVLFQLESPSVCAAEAARVLKAGGQALVIDWTDAWGGAGPHPDHVVSESSAKPLFEAAGLRRVRSIAAGEHHWGAVFEKRNAPTP